MRPVVRCAVWLPRPSRWECRSAVGRTWRLASQSGRCGAAPAETKSAMRRAGLAEKTTLNGCFPALNLARGGHRRKEERIGRKEASPCPSPIFKASSKRSEEHTSELQSLMRISYAVFCLKKKKKSRTDKHTQAMQ